MFEGRAVRQMGYYVEDARAAAQRHVEIYNAGPFIIMPKMVLPITHRGVAMEMDVTLAFGQWGGMQVELIQQNNKGPSPFRDVYPEGSGKYGFHHIAMFVDNMADACAECEKAGHPVVTRIAMPDGKSEAIYADGRATFGHYIEAYERIPLMTASYDYVAKIAKGWDGKNPVRDAKWEDLRP
jgi:hypothetical protein